MGKKAECIVCGKSAGFSKFQYWDGVVCYKCVSTAIKKLPRTYASAVEVQRVVKYDLSAVTADEKEMFIQTLDKLSADVKEAEKAARMDAIQAKIRENNVPVKSIDNTPKCPKCGSTSISANQKGFGIGKAVIGAAVAGPLGLVAGNAGAKKVYITCLNCGYRWQAGKK